MTVPGLRAGLELLRHVPASVLRGPDVHDPVLAPVLRGGLELPRPPTQLVHRVLYQLSEGHKK